MNFRQLAQRKKRLLGKVDVLDGHQLGAQDLNAAELDDSALRVGQGLHHVRQRPAGIEHDVGVPIRVQ